MELSPYSNRDSPDKIWFLRRARGDSHVERFIERLDPRTYAATGRVFDWVETRGPLHDTERLRHLSGDVLEIKVHHPVSVRYVGFRADIGVVVTRAVRKPQTAVLQQLIRQTQWLHDEYE
ncbi:MAG TPA: hypothetical protein VLQ52_05505, partial [Coriobacteriia bacterium]|nr:hypothetical protein [Coriobacteriia bacterium]